MQEKLTEAEFWDDRWEDLVRPQKVTYGDYPLTDGILDFFKRHLQDRKGGAVLELGAAPGQYLTTLTADFDLDSTALDYSEEGCRRLKDNFDHFKVTGKIVKGDLFSDSLVDELGQFDVVYSLGLVEHFVDFQDVVKRHLNFVKPGGVLILGVPNIQGMYKYYWERLAPDLLSKHCLENMLPGNWNSFRDDLGLEELELSYVGGFNPYVLKKSEVSGHTCLKLSANILQKMFSRRFNILRSLKHPKLTNYLMGAYRKSEK